MNKFIGRAAELKRLADHAKIGAGLIVIRGRRRIGKSRLVQEYAKTKRFLEFSGLVPTEEMSAQSQRDHFANRSVHQLKISPCTFHNWYDAFMCLSDQLTNKPTVIFFDEISWMADGDSTFIPKLKVWWDITLQKYPHVQLILCGSVSTWIETNIINSTGLFGRISLMMTLDELTLAESYEFLKQIGFKGSDQEVFKLLAVTGGVPWYLQQVNPQLLADANIMQLCFTEEGVLAKEFDRIFNDLYKGDSDIYKNIISALVHGMKTLSELRKELGYAHGGFLGKYVKNLCVAGFVTQHTPWSFKSHKQSKQSLYRLSDNYIRFYVKYMEPNWGKIRNSYVHGIINNLPGWEVIFGLHVENLLLKNRPMLLKALQVQPASLVGDNPYIQRPTKKHKGCQIDYLIQTRENTLIICEFKFQRRPIGPEILDEMQEKMRRLSVPKGFGKAPVLVHISDLADSVVESGYFYGLIDLRDWLN
jgi:AAA+ ATPase superfamily predicted ATPase